MPTLSVDLASRKYADVGIALLSGSPASPLVRLVSPDELALKGVPVSAELAAALDEFARVEGATSIFLDGPQGWRREVTDRVHVRACEAETRTPGKTGPPGVVLPSTWTRMVRFSIGVFDTLGSLGWPRFDGGTSRCAFESFPTHAWRTLGHASLPGKHRAKSDFSAWCAILQNEFKISWHRLPSHDEVQAVVAGIAGLQMEAAGPQGCTICGEAPLIESSAWREGFIVSPRGFRERTL